MRAASSGLNNVSNNVANMKTNGFKRQDVFFSEVANQNNGFDGLGSHTGHGVMEDSSGIRFAAGQMQKTGNNLDIAIDGNGFFVLKKDGQIFYTRDGEFDFNSDGILVDKHSGAHVQKLDVNGNLADISMLDQTTYPGKATTNIDLSGKLYAVEDKEAEGDDKKKVYKSVTQTVTFYDQQGVEKKLTITLKPEEDLVPMPGTDPHTWKIEKLTVDGKDYLPDFGHDTISFNSMTGQPDVDDDISFIYGPNDKTAQKITLNFGKANSSDGVTQVDTSMDPSPDKDSKVEIKKDDGYGVGKLVGYSFNEKGQLVYQYSNAQSKTDDKLALANFRDLNVLNQVDGNMFTSSDNSTRQLGAAGDNGFGRAQGGSVELSNVDVSVEFADIIVYQRMFQACSQVMQIDKQMLETLYGGSSGKS